MQDSSPGALPEGTLLGSWRVLERRGQGNYGTVYRVVAIEVPDSAPLALKLASHPMDLRFAREAELLARIQHPGVPRLHAQGLWPHPAGPFPYLVMEWIEGSPLYDWGREHHPTSRQVLRVLAQIARALEATHASSAVHRDVKGDNVLVRASDGRAVLTDFGVGDYEGARTLTLPPLPPGTPPYRSPEAVRFQWDYRLHPTAHYEARPADDVFALGVTAYQLVTGTYPPPPPGPADAGDSATLPGLVPPRLRNPSVCEELESLILSMLARRPEERLGGLRAVGVAASLEHAAATAGPGADLPLSSSAAPPTRAKSLPLATPGRARWGWLALASLALTLLALRVTAPRHAPPHVESEVALREATVNDARDAGTVGLGDHTVASPVAILAPVPSFNTPRGLALPLPDRPFPGQRKPPCNRTGEVELRGGCWYELARAKPPCKDDAYDYKGACYLPSFPAQRPHTSAPTTQPQD
jgi:hypothetical protein